MYIIFVVLILTTMCGYSISRPHQIPSTKALDFMKKYGYLQNDDGDSEALYTEGGISDIIKVMQKFGGINETGVFDEATIRLISLPRCGVPDVIKTNREKRYILGPIGWQKRNISYFLSNWSPKLGESVVQTSIEKALNTWGSYGRLNFYRKNSVDADIIVAFAQGYHGDTNAFDGSGGILAHAYFPSEVDGLGGDIHFDADEFWVEKSVEGEGTEFYPVALHELGHSLGLAHSPVQSSIMFPYYQDHGEVVQLGYDDILAMYDMYIRRTLKEDIEIATRKQISSIYTSTTEVSKAFTEVSTTFTDDSGTSIDVSTTSKEWRTTNKQDTSFTTESTVDQYTIYTPTIPESTTDSSATSPSTVYEVTTVSYEGDNETVDEHKKHDNKHHIPTTNAPSLPDICDGNFDAIATLREELFVFREEYVWRFHDIGRLTQGYPVKLSSMFPLLPKHIKKIDAAYQRADGMIVLFTGNVFWVYDGEKFLERSPQPLTHYGLPEYLTDLDAVQNWARNKKTYFYKNDRFWRYNETSKKMDEDYPQHMSRWRGVPSYLDGATTWKDGITYFFRGGLFWKFDNNWIIVTEESPLPTPTIWFGCPEYNNIIMNAYYKDP